MVPILVLLTFVAFIALTLVLSQERQTAVEGSPGEALRAPPGRAWKPDPFSYLHPGHVWVRFAPDGVATVGASDFAANFAGALRRVETPEAGRRLRQGEPAWTLVSARNRRLTQAMPLDGEVLEVNRALAAGHPDAKRSDWILKIRPNRIAENLQNLFGGPLADAWQELSGLRLNAALAPALGRVANDGGIWIENFGDLLEESDWQSLRRDLFPPGQETGPR